MVTIEHAVTELLTEAREFISDPSRWCQGDMALDRSGRPVADERLDSATRCCAVGAAVLATFRRGLYADTFHGGNLIEFLDRAAIRLYPDSEDDAHLGPTAWVNDHLGHAAILQVYDAAIAASQETA